MEVYREYNRYKNLITYTISGEDENVSFQPPEAISILIIKAHNVANYRWSDNYFIDPSGGPFIVAGLFFNTKDKKYTVTKLLRYTVDKNKINTPNEDFLHEYYTYDITVYCEYKTEPI